MSEQKGINKREGPGPTPRGSTLFTRYPPSPEPIRPAEAGPPPLLAYTPPPRGGTFTGPLTELRDSL